MPDKDHLSKIRDALDEFIGDDVPGTIAIDRPGKTDMVVITQEAFEQLTAAAHRLNEIEGSDHGEIDHDAMIKALRTPIN